MGIISKPIGKVISGNIGPVIVNGGGGTPSVLFEDTFTEGSPPVNLTLHSPDTIASGDSYTWIAGGTGDGDGSINPTGTLKSLNSRFASNIDLAPDSGEFVFEFTAIALDDADAIYIGQINPTNTEDDPLVNQDWCALRFRNTVCDIVTWNGSTLTSRASGGFGATTRASMRIACRTTGLSVYDTSDNLLFEWTGGAGTEPWSGAGGFYIRATKSTFGFTGPITAYDGNDVTVLG